MDLRAENNRENRLQVRKETEDNENKEDAPYNFEKTCRKKKRI